MRNFTRVKISKAPMKYVEIKVSYFNSNLSTALNRIFLNTGDKELIEFLSNFYKSLCIQELNSPCIV